jgi:hypothetical protein
MTVTMTIFTSLFLLKVRIFLDLPVRQQKREGDYVYDQITRQLSVRDAKKSDQGVYACMVKGIGSCPACDDNKQQTDLVINVYGT